MNTHQEINVPMANVMRQLTVNVRVTEGPIDRWRLWLGLRVIRLGARIMGVGFQVWPSEVPTLVRPPNTIG